MGSAMCGPGSAVTDLVTGRMTNLTAAMNDAMRRDEPTVGDLVRLLTSALINPHQRKELVGSSKAWSGLTSGGY